MKPLVSIIIPVYKTEKYLPYCMNSVLNQTYSNMEIILVDDGSPDNCPALCDQYALQDSRVRVIHQKNGGLSAARNVGKAAATGQYITFLDSDDLLALNTVAYMVELAQKEQAQLVKVGIARKTKIEDCAPIHKDYTVTTGIKVLHSIYKSSPQIISSCGKLYEATLLAEEDFPVGRYYEDEYTTPRIYSKTDKVVLSNSELYFYMQWDNASILRGGLNEKKIRDALFVTQDRIVFFREKGYKKLTQEAIKDHYLKLCNLIEETREEHSLKETYEQMKEQRRIFMQHHLLAVSTVKIRQVLSRIKHMFIN